MNLSSVLIIAGGGVIGLLTSIMGYPSFTDGVANPKNILLIIGLSVIYSCIIIAVRWGKE
jgi:hypothetical protein